jgi:hypothetical protein
MLQDPFVAVANIPGLLLGVWYTLTCYRLAKPEVARSIEKVATPPLFLLLLLPSSSSSSSLGTQNISFL